MEIKTLSINQTTTFGQDNQPRQRFQVTFMVDRFGPFTEFFTQEEFTPDQVATRQRARAATVEGIAATSS